MSGWGGIEFEERDGYVVLMLMLKDSLFISY